MISKDLLNEVLPYASITNELISYGLNKEGDLLLQYDDIDEIVNIYELAHRCKEWVISRGYDILSGGLEAGLYSCYIDYSDKRYTLQMNPLHHEFADTESEAIFKACQCILDNKGR